MEPYLLGILVFYMAWLRKSLMKPRYVYYADGSNIFELDLKTRKNECIYRADNEITALQVGGPKTSFK